MSTCTRPAPDSPLSAKRTVTDCGGVGGARAHPLRRPARLLPGRPRPCRSRRGRQRGCMSISGVTAATSSPRPRSVLRPGGVRASYRLIVTAGEPPAPVDAAQLREFLDPRTPIPHRPCACVSV